MKTSIATLVLAIFAWCFPAKSQSALLYAGTTYNGVPCSGGVTMPAYAQSGNYCAPDSIAMLLGYWDIKRGYSNLLPGVQTGSSSTNSNGSGIYLTANEQSLVNTLSGPLYCNTDPNNGTLIGNIMPSITNYASSAGYKFNTALTRPGDLATGWSTLVANINAGNPMLFWIDLNGTGNPDHITPVFGYEVVNGVDYYATYNTGLEDESVVWIQFQLKGNGPTYPLGGVYEEFQITPQATPEPPTWALMFMGATLSLFVFRRRNHSS